MASGNAYWLTEISKAAKEFIAIWILLGKCTFRLWHAIKKVFFSDVWRIVYIVNLFGSFLVWILLANSIKDKFKKKIPTFSEYPFCLISLSKKWKSCSRKVYCFSPRSPEFMFASFWTGHIIFKIYTPYGQCILLLKARSKYSVNWVFN